MRIIIFHGHLKVLSKVFMKKLMKLSNELHDAEDAENSRHKEHQEKLLALRARQATYREEFLRKESLALQQQYQQASMSHLSNNPVPGEQHGYHPAAVATPAVAAVDTYGEAHRGYASAQYEPFGDRPDYAEFRGGGRGRGRGNEPRSQYSGGRAYNSGGRRF